MYAEIEKTILQNLPDPSASFVFPSEVAAASWARRALEISGVRALSTDRFLGWDTFKEKLFAVRSGARPAESRSRILWAASVLADNARKPFLSSLIRPEHRDEHAGYIPYVSGILPGLKRIQARAGRAPGDPKILDLCSLYERYRTFLSGRGLFEPAWEGLPAPSPDSTYFLFSPDLAEDYEEYRAALARTPGIRIVGLPEPEQAPVLLEFPNAYEELRWIFLSAARDLDAGLRPEEIAVTVADLDRAAPWVEKAAALSGVPARIRSGPPLSAHPVGRFLAAAANCAERGFDLESVSAFLLDRFPPWKDSQAVRELVRFGIRRHAFAPFHSRGRPVDPWLESFRVCEPRMPGLESFYRKLKSGVEKLAGAPDFRALASAFVAFRREFLDESRLSDEDERSFQRAMIELEGFAREAASLSLPCPEGSAFSLFRSALSQIRYVPQSGAPAVSVYAYRVSALAAVRKHYVSGCSQEGFKVSFGDAPGLRDDQKEALGFPDRDASPLYAWAYAASGSTVFSYAVESLGGFSLPYPWFSRFGTVGTPEDYQALRNEDPWKTEERAWAGGGFPALLLAPQARAARDAAVCLRPPASDYERDIAAPDAASLARAGFTDTDGRLRLSATLVEEVLSCPFAWLLARGLDLEEEASGVGFFDARLAGSMAHDVLRRLYKKISASGPFDPKRLAEYISWIEGALEETIPYFERNQGPFLRPMFEAYAPQLSDRVRRLLEEETRVFAGWEMRLVEEEFRKDYPALDALLVGRLDRLAQRDQEYAIIDYKKRSIPRPADVYPDGDGALKSLQVAAYVLVCEASGKPVSRARYWSLEDAKALDVLGPGALPRNEYDPALAVFEEYLKDAAGRLRRGDFRPPAPEDRDCSGCGWQAVCRARYATEL